MAAVGGHIIADEGSGWSEAGKGVCTDTGHAIFYGNDGIAGEGFSAQGAQPRGLVVSVVVVGHVATTHGAGTLLNDHLYLIVALSHVPLQVLTLIHVGSRGIVLATVATGEYLIQIGAPALAILIRVECLVGHGDGFQIIAFEGSTLSFFGTLHPHGTESCIRKGRPLDGRDAGGNGDVHEVPAIQKSPHPNAFEPIRKGDGREVSTSRKRPFPDMTNGRGYVDFCEKYAKSESRVSYACHTLSNSDLRNQRKRLNRACFNPLCKR